MEAVELQIKNSILKLLKGIDPEVDVYFEEMPHTVFRFSTVSSKSNADSASI